MVRGVCMCVCCVCIECVRLCVCVSVCVCVDVRLCACTHMCVEGWECGKSTDTESTPLGKRCRTD